jgi:hypothetical protein
MKATQSLCKRISRHALSTKQTNKGYYKGTGTGSTGSHTKHGGYIIDWAKVRTYVCPKDLKDFKVRDGPIGSVEGAWLDLGQMLMGAIAHAFCYEDDKAAARQV